MKNPMLEKWESPARALEEEPARVGIPLHVLGGEAVDVARFFETHFATKVDDQGRVTKPGLDQAVNGGRFRPELGAEILELQEATQAAQTQYVLMVSPSQSPMERGLFVLSEIDDALEFLFDDGVQDEDDTRLERLAAAHENPTSQDALAAALDDYAGLAELHSARLSNLGAFELSLIKEAPQLAAKLREQSADKVAGTATEEQQQALDLRNRLAAMLYERMQLVRSAARYVYRHDPDTVRKVTSAYSRQRLAKYRRRKSQQSAAVTPSAATGAANAGAAVTPSAATGTADAAASGEGKKTAS